MSTNLAVERSTAAATERRRIAAFVSHPIQYLTPLWRELSARPDVQLKVFYFSKQALESTVDRGFGIPVAWNIDLLAGHDHEFLPRQWPTRDPRDSSVRALNAGLFRALRQGWDAVYVSGWARRNNWAIAAGCRRYGIPLLCFADSNLSAERSKPALKLAVKRAL
ncbi:MAG TPA: hypothetical protein VJR89_15535, partial [Polyangiales bacterium]|nr:hypothetical protein [Polyangiales bacterium]